MAKALIFTISFLFLQDSNLVFEDIQRAMQAGSAQELVKFFNETIEMKIDGTSNNYSRNQAEVILREFFQSNPARGFSYVHQGEDANEGLKYAIGNYQFDSGSYRVVMWLKSTEDEYRIDTLNFTKE